MDSHNSAVLTLALEQHKQAEEEVARRAAREGELDQRDNSGNIENNVGADEHIQQHGDSKIEETHPPSDKDLKPTKAYSVHPDLKVGMGLVTDISGPRIEGQDLVVFNPKAIGRSKCTRCKKDHTIVDGKVFKLCPHCRQLQRERSKRWQEKTRKRVGFCRRCGIIIPPDQTKFVLCSPCRHDLRTRKAQRFEDGKCTHCAGPNDSREFKVCTRCRSNDKIRRKQLEEANRCNRCGHSLDRESTGRKVCSTCRLRKKSAAKVSQDAAAAVASSQTVVHASTPVHANSDVTVLQQQVQYTQNTDEQVATQLENNLFAQN
ncbi:CYFA0S16e02586g1_1 [Cyberlindnera fabianii]|uniref:CYFA0S16e02586g1_1 n=1 Tax=Cyberlindnera fabianii TaxID=36022 RepID=A0A061B5Q4_CYBFA|nr:White-opaque regulator 3 [Cyberlindnera fabianii]CDR45140.1 CYFA0S16e02586g1_1 [Cyberlindnera fabianii]